MRITAWNCSQGTDQKVPLLFERLAPDIAVVPESHQSPALASGSLLDRGIPHAWTGSWPTKGLGIFGPSADHLEPVPAVSRSGASHGLAVQADVAGHRVNVLGIWTVPFATGTWRSRYMNAAEQILLDNQQLLSQGETIVAGDFNCSGQSDPDGFPEFLAMAKDRFGLRSAYHEFNGIEPGSEAAMTLWWRKKEDAGYHCDLILVPDSWEISTVTVGTYADWGDRSLAASSDHAPITAVLTRGSAATDDGERAQASPLH